MSSSKQTFKLTIKNKVSKFQNNQNFDYIIYLNVEIYYRDMLISNSLWLENGNICNFVDFKFYDLRKYLGLTEKELMKMMIEYLRNKYSVFIKISHLHELRFKLAYMPDIDDLLK